MSALTFFLAKLIGLYCIVVGLTMIANRRTTVEAVNALIRNPPLVLLAGVIAVGIGLGLVIGHNVWSSGALPVVVTVVGWLSLIKGVALLVLRPGKWLSSMKRFDTSDIILGASA
jgi:hypothetical protein